MARHSASIRAALAVAGGQVNLAGYDPDAQPLAPRTKKGKRPKLETDGGHLAELQARLWAEAAAGSHRSVLLVLQGIDTSGKGGVTEHVVGACGPIGVQYTAFKKPTAEEAAHHFLWRIRRHLPPPGVIGVFDRSHYEDVLVPRVHETVPEDEWRRRYDEINAFEAGLVAGGTTVVKCFLNISYDVQRERLLARLDNPYKHWKFSEADLVERGRWVEYQAAYEGMLQHCSTDAAPWHIVPSNDKKYRNWAIAEILRETLEELDPQYPELTLDVPALKARLQPPN